MLKAWQQSNKPPNPLKAVFPDVPKLNPLKAEAGAALLWLATGAPQLKLKGAVVAGALVLGALSPDAAVVLPNMLVGAAQFIGAGLPVPADVLAAG